MNLKRRRSLLMATVIIVVLASSVLLFAALRSKENGALRVADQFQTPPTWTQLAETVEPPRLVCLGDNPCPSVDRRWNAPRDLGAADMRQLITETGWSLPFTDSCEPRQNGAETYRSCSADGTVGDYTVNLTYYSPEQSSDPATVSLSVR